MTQETLTVRCVCGWETIGTEAEIVPATVEHGQRLHNMVPTPAEVLAMVVRPADAESASATINAS